MNSSNSNDINKSAIYCTLTEKRRSELLSIVDKNTFKYLVIDKNKIFTADTNENISFPNNYGYLNIKSDFCVEAGGLMGKQDSRIKIENNRLFPYSCIGILVCTYSFSDETFKNYGTGVLISPYCVLTMKSNYLNNEYGKPFSANFYATYSGISYSYKAKVVDYWILDNIDNEEGPYSNNYLANNIDICDNNEDHICVLFLDEPIGQYCGYLGINKLTNLEKQDFEYFELCGYPSDKIEYKDKSELKFPYSDKVNKLDFKENNKEIEYILQATSGQAGSPIFYKHKTDNNFYLLGIHANSNSIANKGLIINDNAFQKLHLAINNYYKENGLEKEVYDIGLIHEDLTNSDLEILKSSQLELKKVNRVLIYGSKIDHNAFNVLSQIPMPNLKEFYLKQEQKSDFKFDLNFSNFFEELFDRKTKHKNDDTNIIIKNDCQQCNKNINIDNDRVKNQFSSVEISYEVNCLSFINTCQSEELMNRHKAEKAIISILESGLRKIDENEHKGSCEIGYNLTIQTAHSIIILADLNTSNLKNKELYNSNKNNKNSKNNKIITDSDEKNRIQKESNNRKASENSACIQEKEHSLCNKVPKAEFLSKNEQIKNLEKNLLECLNNSKENADITKNRSSTANNNLISINKLNNDFKNYCVGFDSKSINSNCNISNNIEFNCFDNNEEKIIFDLFDESQINVKSFLDNDNLNSNSNYSHFKLTRKRSKSIGILELNPIYPGKLGILNESKRKACNRKKLYSSNIHKKSEMKHLETNYAHENDQILQVTMEAEKIRKRSSLHINKEEDLNKSVNNLNKQDNALYYCDPEEDDETKRLQNGVNDSLSDLKYRRIKEDSGCKNSQEDLEIKGTTERNKIMNAANSSKENKDNQNKHLNNDTNEKEVESLVENELNQSNTFEALGNNLASNLSESEKKLLIREQLKKKLGINDDKKTFKDPNNSKIHESFQNKISEKLNESAIIDNNESNNNNDNYASADKNLTVLKNDSKGVKDSKNHFNLTNNEASKDLMNAEKKKNTNHLSNDVVISDEKLLDPKENLRINNENLTHSKNNTKEYIVGERSENKNQLDSKVSETNNIINANVINTESSSNSFSLQESWNSYNEYVGKYLNDPKNLAIIGQYVQEKVKSNQPLIASEIQKLFENECGKGSENKDKLQTIDRSETENKASLVIKDNQDENKNTNFYKSSSKNNYPANDIKTEFSGYDSSQELRKNEDKSIDRTRNFKGHDHDNKFESNAIEINKNLKQEDSKINKNNDPPLSKNAKKEDEKQIESQAAKPKPNFSLIPQAEKQNENLISDVNNSKISSTNKGDFNINNLARLNFLNLNSNNTPNSNAKPNQNYLFDSNNDINKLSTKSHNPLIQTEIPLTDELNKNLMNIQMGKFSLFSALTNKQSPYKLEEANKINDEACEISEAQADKNNIQQLKENENQLILNKELVITNKSSFVSEEDNFSSNSNSKSNSILNGIKSLSSFDLNSETANGLLLSVKAWELIKNWLLESKKKDKEKLPQDPVIKLSLLHKANLNGFSSKIFKEKCIDKANTLTVVLTSHGKLIGGFTPLEWKKASNDLRNDKKLQTFLFSVSNEEVYWLKTKFQAIVDDDLCGPVFGKKDLEIVDDCDKISNSCENIGNNFLYGKRDKEAFYGGKTYTVVDYEVYEVLFRS